MLKIVDSLLVLEDPVVVLVTSLLLKVPAIVKLVSLRLSFLQKTIIISVLHRAFPILPVGPNTAVRKNRKYNKR